MVSKLDSDCAFMLCVQRRLMMIAITRDYTASVTRHSFDDMVYFINRCVHACRITLHC